MMDCASIYIQCEASDLSLLSVSNENREGNESSALVPLAIAIDLECTEVAVEESEGAFEEPEVAVAAPEVSAVGTGQEVSIKEVYEESSDYKMCLNMMEMENEHS